MKPNFALSLSFDGIRLLHRAAGGWHLVGDIPVTGPDLPRALAKLRRAGARVKTRQIRTKLIIPDDQIKYLSIQTGPLDDAARREAARKALDGATPYPVDALAFDISPEGDTTHVAAVARETLTEAEAFAIEHRFHPVSFVAAPTGPEFPGEPFFGPTAVSKSILADGVEVEADGVRVVIVGDAEPAPDDDKDGQDQAVTAETDTDETPSTAVETPPVDEAQAQGEPTPSVEATQDGAPPDAAATDTPDTTQDAAKGVNAPEPVVAKTAQTVEVAAPDTAAAIEPRDTKPADQGVKEPAEKPTETSDTKLDSEAAPENENENENENETTTPPLLGFATRRRQDPSTKLTPLGGATRGAPKKPSMPKLVPTPPKPPAVKADTPATPETSRAAATASLRAPDPVPDTPTPQDAPAPARTGGFLSRRKAPVKTAPPAPGRKGRNPIAARKAVTTNAPGGDLEAERMTVFGARGDGTIGGKPRFLGLILTAVLLIFLVGVAAWASVFLDDGLAKLFPGRERTLASTLPYDAQEALAADVGATTITEPTSQGGDEVIVAALNDSLSDGLTAEDAAVLDALRDPQPDPAAPEELDAAALEARYAVTGIWPKAPDIPAAPADLIEIEDLYVTGIDPISPALDAVAMPSAASFQTDRQLAVITSPAAAGTNFARDENGRIVATVDGALSPDGFTVFLGRPPVEPPATLARFQPAPESSADLNALAEVRPRPRPSDLIEQNERATLGGLSRAELAGLRPRLRPEAPQVIAAQEAEEAAEPDAVDAPVSALAAAASLRPEGRPRNFQRIVSRAQSTAPEPQRVAAVAPRTITPSIPTTASVAREATVRNAINLRRVNLIGVYGTPSNRRALVRLGNGRYQKVKVGDRFDGGRVSAIGDSELRYQKSGRNVVLKMPSG